MKERGTTGAGESRSLEFLVFIDTSSWHTVLMDVAQLGTTFSLVEPGCSAQWKSPGDMSTDNLPRHL